MSHSKDPDVSCRTFSLDDVEDLPDLGIEGPDSSGRRVEDPKPSVEGGASGTLTTKLFTHIPDTSPHPLNLLPSHANPALTIFEEDLDKHFEKSKIRNFVEISSPEGSERVDWDVPS